jgi:hypothetical protein
MLPDSDRDKHMGEGEDERVRRRAYDIWEREGRPHGREEEHWRLAREEVARESRSTGGTQAVPATRVGAPGAESESPRQQSQPAPEQRSSGTEADPLGTVQGESAGFGAGISDHMVENTTGATQKAKPRSGKPRASRAKKPAGTSGAPGGPERPR